MFKRIFVCTCILFVSFIFFVPREGADFLYAAEKSDVVINEICWMGNGNSSADEWIELYNNTDDDIDLTGWRILSQDGNPDIIIEGIIAPNGYFLIERTDDDSVPDVAADFITSFGGGLGNSGEVLELYDDSGMVIDSTPLLGDGGWVAGDNAEKLTMARIDVSISGHDISNWQNSQETGGTPRTPGGDNPNFGEDVINNNEALDVVISEIAWMGNENSSSDEWIELYNSTNSDIDLEGWRIVSQDGNPDIIIEGIIESLGYFLIERTDDESVPDVTADFITSFGGGLGNSGEVLELYDAANILIDSTPLLGDGGWAAGDNGEKLTMERVDIIIKGDNIANWQSSAFAGGTPRDKNSDIPNDEENNYQPPPAQESSSGGSVAQPVSSPSESELQEVSTNDNETFIESDPLSGKNGVGNILREGFFLSGRIIINEIYPNPPGIDINNEFIELKNIGGQEINAAGWSIKNKLSRYVVSNDDFKITIIPAGGFFLLPRTLTNIALNNNGDKVELYSDAGKKIDIIEYRGYANEGVSYIRYNEKWQWSAAISVGSENFFIAPNRAPSAIIDSKGIFEALVGEELIFDGSDSFDPDGDQLSYLWKSSDGGQYNDIAVKKKFNEPGKYKVMLKVFDEFNNESDSIFEIKILDDFWQDDSFINESAEPLMYKQKWEDIIIYEVLPNPAGDDVKGEWIKVYNNEDYSVNLGGWVIDDKEGGSSPYQIPDDVIIGANNFFIFDRAKTGIALNNDTDEARLFNPDGNFISIIEYGKAQEGQVFAFDGEKEDGQGQEAQNTEDGEMKKVQWSELEKYSGEKIRIDGKVSARPGVLGIQVFYITNEMSGLEVYCYKKDFPQLERGDYVSVIGILSNESGQGGRLKIESGDDIEVLSYDHPPLAKELTLNLLGKEYLHSLISIRGQVMEKKMPNMYLDDDIGEVKIYFKDSVNISLKDIAVGDMISATGILDFLNGEYRLLPRDQEDINIIGGRVLGSADVKSEEGDLEDGYLFSEDYSETKRKRLIVYLSLSCFALAVVSIILIKRSGSGSL